ncbi:MAG TPA: hypothetical protein VGM64_07425 [Lacunisphaera sp.]|jgi:hypothetical protein
MNLTWHLVKKDLYRLRTPLTLFSLLMIGENLFYAAIGGLFQTPDLGWLNRLQNIPELLLSILAEPLIAYFLVGWLVFEDSPVEKDAHWITRPISGGQLFAAKLTGAALMFVVWPLILNLLWWSACGFGWPELLVASRVFVIVNPPLLALGLACAALTDGYPRFILWSLVGLIVFVVLQLTFNFSGSDFSNFGLSRLLVGGLSCGIISLVIAAYQFVTRRHRKSLALVAAGLLMVGFVSGAWRWNFVGDRPLRLAADDPRYTGMTLKLAGPARYQRVKGRPYFHLPVQIGGLPDAVAVVWISARGEWSLAGRPIWTSRIEADSSGLRQDTIRRLLGIKPKPLPQTDSQTILTGPFSPLLAQQTTHEPAAFHGYLDLHLTHGKIAAELPLRETATQKGTRAFTVSFLSSGSLKEKRPATTAAKMATAQNGVSLLLTERSAGGWQSTGVLVNRRTGEFFLSDPVRSGPEAITALNQAKVTCWRLTFLMGSSPIRLDDLSLVVIRFGENELLTRELKVDPVPWLATPSNTPRL